MIVTITTFDWPSRHGAGRMSDGRNTGHGTTTLEHVMSITTRPPIVMTEGSGSWLQDSEGRRYLDFVQGWAVNCLGHCHPACVEALRAQAARLINCSPAFHNAPHGAAGQRWWPSRAASTTCSSATAGRRPTRARSSWRASGASAHRGGAFEIVTTHGSFHGRTLATMAATGKPAFEPLFEPKVPGFGKVPLNDLDAMAAAITDAHGRRDAGADPGRGRRGPATDDYLRGAARADRGSAACC